MAALKYVILLFILKLFYVTAHYKRQYIEDLCGKSDSGDWSLGSANANSSGILETSRKGAFLPGKNCTVSIQPPLGYGVVLSVKRLDFRPYYPPHCLSHIQVHDNDKILKLCGYSNDILEYQSYHSEGKPLEIKFVTVNESGSQYHSDVTFIVTSYVKFPYNCEVKMYRCQNSRCIWKGLICDGHNNCGDQSDEFSHIMSKCGTLPSGLIAGIVVISVLGFLVLVLVPLACSRRCSRCRRSRNSVSEPVPTQPAANYGSRPVTGNIQEVHYPTTSSSDNRYQDLPPEYKP